MSDPGPFDFGPDRGDQNCPRRAGESKTKPFNGPSFFVWPKTFKKTHHPGGPVHSGICGLAAWPVCLFCRLTTVSSPLYGDLWESYHIDRDLGICCREAHKLVLWGIHLG